MSINRNLYPVVEFTLRISFSVIFSAFGRNFADDHETQEETPGINNCMDCAADRDGTDRCCIKLGAFAPCRKSEHCCDFPNSDFPITAFDNQERYVCRRTKTSTGQKRTRCCAAGNVVLRWGNRPTEGPRSRGPRGWRLTLS